jgi:hypothetical protein
MSFTVPPSFVRISRTMSRSRCVQSKRRCGPIGTLKGVGDAGRAACPGHRRIRGRVSRVREPRPITQRPCQGRGRPRRDRGASPHVVGEQPQRARRGTRHPVMFPDLDPVAGILAHECAQRVHAGDAVDQAVMDLRDDGEVTALEALHEPKLPHRLRAIELLRHDTAHEPLEATLVARGRKCGVPNVVDEVEVLVVHPDRMTRHRRALESLAEAGHPLETRTTTPGSCRSRSARRASRAWVEDSRRSRRACGRLRTRDRGTMRPPSGGRSDGMPSASPVRLGSARSRWPHRERTAPGQAVRSGRGLLREPTRARLGR